jgi:hypothetical protein
MHRFWLGFGAALAVLGVAVGAFYVGRGSSARATPSSSTVLAPATTAALATVPDVIGYPAVSADPAFGLSTATSEMTKAQLGYTLSYHPISGTEPVNYCTRSAVDAESPGAGSMVAPGTVITLYVVTCPNP